MISCAMLIYININNYFKIVEFKLSTKSPNRTKSLLTIAPHTRSLENIVILLHDLLLRNLILVGVDRREYAVDQVTFDECTAPYASILFC